MVRNWRAVIPIFPSVTGAEIRLVKKGCRNRNFFQIGVCPRARRPDLAPNEVIGGFDPMPNERGEKWVSLDVDRFSYWLGQGAHVADDVKNILGIAGVLPIPPDVVLTAAKNRKEAAEAAASQQNQTEGSPQ